MKEPPSTDELKQQILEIIREDNIQHAAHQAPTHSHAQILDLRLITELRRLGRVLRVKYYGKLPRPELIAGIVEKMSQPDSLSLLLNMLDKSSWGFFQIVASEHEYKEDSLFPDFYLFAQHAGLLQSFFHEGEILFVVPDEIKSTFQKLKETGYIEEKEFHEAVVDMAIAAVNLYGVISQKDFVALFNSHHERQTTVDEVFPILIRQVYAEIGFCFWSDYIVDDSFEEDDFKSVKSLLRDRKGKPRYNPPFEQFIQYADWNYREDTPQWKVLGKRLERTIPDPENVLDLIEELYDAFRSESSPQEYFELLSEHGVNFKDMDQVKDMMKLLVDAKNNTRLWSNYGHTPNELASRGPSKIIPFPGR